VNKFHVVVDVFSLIFTVVFINTDGSVCLANGYLVHEDSLRSDRVLRLPFGDYSAGWIKSVRENNLHVYRESDVSLVALIPGTVPLQELRE
jgi:hypothetical protein